LGLAGGRTDLAIGAVEDHLRSAGIDCSGPLTADLLAGGRSNLTYRLSDGTRRWVLRRPPLGHVLATAHDMGREFVVLRALHGTAIPVPRPLLLCEDARVIGAPFLLMEHVAGPVIDGASAAASLAPADARRCAETLVDHLAALHALRPEEVGLQTLGRPEGFVRRQIRRWCRQWDASAPTRCREFDQLVAILEDNLPERGDAAIVHGDYRLGNVILSPGDPGRIAAIIDWEMATLGDPLADVGLLHAYWDPASSSIASGGHAVSANPGFPGADHLVARYCELTGREFAELAFYVVFGRFKLAAIGQTIAARHAAGDAVGEALDDVPRAVDALLTSALTFAARLDRRHARG
jgi:aminoglycoside phosphotransferase (APT) family kinase protein